MSRPESFVRATPEELRGWWLERFWAGPDIKAALAALRDAVVAELNAERDRQWSLWQVRAERAEAEVARLTREVASLTNFLAVRQSDVAAECRRADKAEAALADAQRAGAWEAARKIQDGVYAAVTHKEAYRFVDQVVREYAPPAPEPPSVDCYEGPIVSLSLTEMSDGGERLLITPEVAKRIVALAQEAK